MIGSDGRLPSLAAVASTSATDAAPTATARHAERSRRSRHCPVVPIALCAVLLFVFAPIVVDAVFDPTDRRVFELLRPEFERTRHFQHRQQFDVDADLVDELDRPHSRHRREHHRPRADADRTSRSIEPIFNVFKPKREVKVRRCGIELIKHIRRLCNDCVGRLHSEEMADPPSDDNEAITDTCCKKRCADEDLLIFCCN